MHHVTALLGGPLGLSGPLLTDQAAGAGLTPLATPARACSAPDSA
jgi:hypothetical protein